MSSPVKTCQTSYLTEKGFSLIELLTVISVVGILVTVLVFSFQRWNSGYIVESQIKEMQMDLMNTRARAMQRSRMHFVDLTASQYTIYEDTDPAPDGDGIPNTASDTQVNQRIFNARYPVIFTNAQLLFNNDGISINDAVICSTAVADADYDCVEISATRINMGQLETAVSDGGACNADKCLER